MGGVPKKARRAAVQGQEDETTTVERGEPNGKRQVQDQILRGRRLKENWILGLSDRQIKVLTRCRILQM